jgi:hypothetical protein
MQMSVGLVRGPDDGQQHVTILTSGPRHRARFPRGDFGSDRRIRPDLLHGCRMAGDDRYQGLLFGTQRPCPAVLQRHDMGGDRVVMGLPNLPQSRTVEEFRRLRVQDVQTRSLLSLCLIKYPSDVPAMTVGLARIALKVDELEPHYTYPGSDNPRHHRPSARVVKTGVVTDYSYSASLP